MLPFGRKAGEYSVSLMPLEVFGTTAMLKAARVPLDLGACLKHSTQTHSPLDYAVGGQGCRPYLLKLGLSKHRYGIGSYEWRE